MTEKQITDRIGSQIMDLMEEQEQSLDVRKYIDIVLRNWWILIVPPIITTIAATFWAIQLPKVYEASTLILVESKQLQNSLVAGIAISTNVNERIAALREEILSWPRLMQLVERLGMDDGIEGSNAIDSLIRNLKKNIHVVMGGKSNLITIAYENTKPETAQQVVKTISDILISSNLASQSAEADDAIDFIKEQLEDYRLKLEKSEDQLRQFQEAYTVSLPVAARVNEQIIDLEIELNQLLIDNTESHPAVISLSKKIEQLKGEREKELRKMESQGVNVRDTAFQAIAYSVPRQQQELARLQRDTQVNAGLYEQLLQRLESAKISKRLDSEEEGTRFKVIEPPRLPYKPVKPDVFRIILFGCALGVGLGAGIVFLKEVGNQSFRSVEEAKKALPLPIMGAISTIDIDRMYRIYTKMQKKGERKRTQKRIDQAKGNGTYTKPNPIVVIAKGIGKVLGL